MFDKFFGNFEEWFKKNEDDLNSLSKALVYLSAQLYTHNSEMAQMELEEMQAIVRLLDTPDISGKKMSVAEAEKRGLVDTSNNYGIMKAQKEAVEQHINSLKVRIRVLAGEKFLSNETA